VHLKVLSERGKKPVSCLIIVNNHLAHLSLCQQAK
jgi:hypothetical protein